MASIGTMAISLTDYLNVSLAYLRQPVTNLEQQKSDLVLKRGVFTDLTEKLSAFEDVLDRFKETGTSSPFNSKAITSSAETVVTATATADAQAGSHSVFVTQLARAHAVLSGRYDQDGTALSQSMAGTRSFSITVDGQTHDVSVDISAGDTDAVVLADIASAISDATGGEVMASYVADTPATGKLSIRSASTGTAGSMVFTDTDGLLGALGVTNAAEATDTAGGYIYADLGGNQLDALFAVDGINIVSSDNVAENVLGGLTITLLGEQEAGDSPVTLTVAVDTDSIKADVEEFLEAYNEVFTYLKAKTRVDGVTYDRGILAGEYPYVSLRTALRGSMSSYISGASAGYNALSQIGITSDRGGNYSVSDSSLLDEVIASGPQALESLFGGEGGIATDLADLISGYTGTAGTISSSEDGVSARMDLIDSRIERLERSLAIQEKSLRAQYASLQEALYGLEQTSSMSNMFSSLLGL